MGNQNILQKNSPLATAGWEAVNREPDREIYYNRVTGEEIEGYSYLINDEAQFELEKSAFNFRLNSDCLVASKYFVENNERNMCSISFKGKVFFESIPCRLSKIDQIPYPDVLHVYYQCFTGFKELFEFAGYFDVTEDLICINKQGVVKVWLNPSLQKIRPDVSYGGLSLEREMVDRAIKIIDKNTNHSTLPFSIVNFFMQSNPSTFQQALNVLNQFTLKTKMPIPSNLKSAEQLLGMPSQVFVTTTHHEQMPQPQSIAAYELSQAPQSLRNIRKYQTINSIPTPVDSDINFGSSITPLGNRRAYLPPRTSSKHCHNPYQSFKANQSIKQTISNQLTRKGISVDGAEQNVYVPGIYESPPPNSKINKQALSNDAVPLTSNFAMPRNAHNSSNLYNTQHSHSTHNSQAGSFQFKNHNVNTKQRQVIKPKQEIHFAKPTVDDLHMRNMMTKTTPMVNNQTNINKNNVFHNQAHLRHHHEPQHIQFRPLDHQIHNIHKQVNHHNLLKQSNQNKINKNRTVSLENVSSSMKQPHLKTEVFRDKPLHHQFKPPSKIVHNQPIKQIRAPTLQFHQHQNILNTVNKQVPSISKRSANKADTNHPDRAALNRLNIDTQLRQSNTPLQYVVKTPTHIMKHRQQNTAQKVRYQQQELQRNKHHIQHYASAQVKHLPINQSIRSAQKQISRFSAQRKYQNYEGIEVVSSFDDSKGFRLSNPTKALNFGSTQMMNNPYLQVRKPLTAENDEPNRFSAKKVGNQYEKIENKIENLEQRNESFNKNTKDTSNISPVK